MNITAVRLPKRSIVLHLKHFVYRALRSSFWWNVISLQMSEERALKLSGLKRRRDTLKTIVMLLGARIENVSLPPVYNYSTSPTWLIEYDRAEYFEGLDELGAIEWFLAREGLHPDGGDTRRILHSDGSTVWG